MWKVGAYAYRPEVHFDYYIIYTIIICYTIYINYIFYNDIVGNIYQGINFINFDLGRKNEELFRSHQSKGSRVERGAHHTSHKVSFSKRHFTKYL